MTPRLRSQKPTSLSPAASEVSVNGVNGSVGVGVGVNGGGDSTAGSSSSSSSSSSATGATGANGIVMTLCRLLVAPTFALILSVGLTSRYVTLMLVFILTSIKPLWYYCTATQVRLETLQEQVSATLQMQKRMMVQFSVLASFIWIYHKTTSACGGDRNVHEAFGNARAIIELEQWLGLDVEPSWQKAALPHTYAMAFFNQYYARTHFVVPILTAGYLLATKQDGSYFYRGSFALALVLALFGYSFLPTMPPRLLRRYANTYPNELSDTTSLHLQDWLQMIDSLRESKSTYDELHSAMGNPYAAMPSMHTGWATWSFLSVWDVTSTSYKPKARTMWRMLLGFHVLTIMYSTIVTANHYVLDLAAGMLCVVLGRRAMTMILMTRFCITATTASTAPLLPLTTTTSTKSPTLPLP